MVLLTGNGKKGTETGGFLGLTEQLASAVRQRSRNMGNLVPNERGGR